jgi:uncharacterized protein (TIGR02611 family)
MFAYVRKHWREFKEDEPGRRFRDRYDRNQERERGRFDVGRLVNLTVGPVLVIFSVFFGWAPGPGMLTLFIGLGMISSEFRPAATSLDWAEIEVRRLWRICEVVWASSTPGERVLILLALVACVIALVSAVYYLFFA